MQHDKVIEHVSGWLKDYCDNSGMNGFVVGVSGGIDSAVTSTLSARTGKRVIVVGMPIYQAPGQQSLSEQHMNWLCEKYPNVEQVSVELDAVFKAMEDTYPKDVQDNLTMANTRARLRMTTLYVFAAHHRMLVAGTGNKVEDFGVGFYTKYGDGGVDLSPIADLMKTEVYAVAKALGVIQGIQDAAPTDGLWDDGRTDEGQLGASYAELEWAMRHVESGASDAGVTDAQKAVLATYNKFNTANKHKMEPLPVCMIPEALRS